MKRNRVNSNGIKPEERKFFRYLIRQIDYNNDSLIVFTYYDKQSVFYIDISDLEEWVDNWDGK